MLATISWQLIKRGIDLTWIHILAADSEHVIDATKNAMRQPRIGPTARIRIVGPKCEIARDKTYHRLGCTLEMRVDRCSSLTKRHSREAFRVANFCVIDVLPTQLAPSLRRACDIHPRRHFRHLTAINY